MDQNQGDYGCLAVSSLIEHVTETVLMILRIDGRGLARNPLGNHHFLLLLPLPFSLGKIP